jgi:phosphatidylglycerophosphate synthase
VRRVHDSALAFKAYEIEELADIYFFRPLGFVVALAAERLGLSPTHVTFIGLAIGIFAGALFYDDSLGLLAFALLILHSVVDSADGQLARMTGRTTEFGRFVDGVSGYTTHAAIYAAIMAQVLARGGSLAIVGVAGLAAVANIVHAQLYDYFRTSYADIAVHGSVPRRDVHRVSYPLARGILGLYGAMQQLFVGRHAEVEAVVAARAPNGVVLDADRARYRQCFYWTVRGWNLLGDNTRFYALGVLAWLHHLDWFFAFVLIPMNVALALLWLWQRRADRRFLAPAVVG